MIYHSQNQRYMEHFYFAWLQKWALEFSVLCRFSMTIRRHCHGYAWLEFISIMHGSALEISAGLYLSSFYRTRNCYLHFIPKDFRRVSCVVFVDFWVLGFVRKVTKALGFMSNKIRKKLREGHGYFCELNYIRPPKNILEKKTGSGGLGERNGLCWSCIIVMTSRSKPKQAWIFLEQLLRPFSHSFRFTSEVEGPR